MPSERIQRRIDALLDEADAALSRQDWPAAAGAARAVLAIDEANEDAAAYLRMAEANLGTTTAPAEATPPPPSAVAEQPTAFAAGRYQVKRFLGEGGKKKVFLAYDALLDRDIAFALIKTEGLDDVGRERVTREAQAMGRMGAHPHVVNVFDLGEEGGAPYIVTELMGGGDVEGELERAGGPLALTRSLEVAKGVARGLAFAHERGVVHRDLKPGNVWLTADGVAKIGDFGLAVAQGRSRLTQHGLMVGTFGYMPPEQALGGEATPQSDLYSLGAMLYELVTGRPPFEGDTPTAVISQHLNTAPVAPSWHTEHCPPPLEDLILALLQKDPARRPASAAEVLNALDAIDPTQKSRSHSTDTANPLDRLAHGTFVGREPELRRLRDAVDSAFLGRGSVVMLVGEPGIGKTRTVQELETYARLRGAGVYWGRTHESSGMPAFWPWIQVGRAWGAVNDVAAAAASLRDPELLRLFPELRQLLPDAPPLPDRQPDESAQFLLFDAYTQFVRAQSQQQPWIIVLDDLHWADKPTLLLLQYVARELANMRVLVVGTYRDTDLARTHPLSEALAELNREGGFDRVTLKGLSRDEVADYLHRRTAVAPSQQLVDRIFDETEGNPFFLAEVVNLMTEEGTLTADSVADMQLPDGVREALGRRLDRLSEEANALLQVAAIAGREFAYETLTLLDDSDPDRLLNLIEEALRARVIEETGRPGHYRFAHALMQETLLDELSTTRRVRLHGQVGEALERRWGQRAADNASRLALHFSESATLAPAHADKAVRYLVLAAEQAESRFAWAEAQRLYERALALLTASDAGAAAVDTASLQVRLFRTAQWAGDYRTAWRAFQVAASAFRETNDAAGFARLAADVIGGFYPTRVLAQILQDWLTIATNPAERRPILAALLMDYIADELSVETRGAMLAELERLQQQSPDRGTELRLLEARASDAVRGDDLAQAVSLQRSAVDLARRTVASVSTTNVGYLGPFAWNLVQIGELDEARAVLELALEASRKLRATFFAENHSAYLASLYLLRGHLADSRRLAAEYADSRSYVWAGNRCYDLLAAGLVDDAIAALPDPSIVGRIPFQHVHCRALCAGVLWASNRTDEAIEHWRAAEATIAEVSPTSGSALLRWTVGYLDAAGPALLSGALAEEVRSKCRRGGAWEAYRALPNPPVTLLRIGAHWLVTGGEIEAGEARYEQALAWCQEQDLPLETGRCWQGLAEVAELRGDLERANRCFDEAGAIFARLGAKYFLDQVIARKQILKA